MRQLWKPLFLFFLLQITISPALAAAQDTLIPGGAAIGLELQTDGVYVTDYSPDGSPARDAGIRIGDRIDAIAGSAVTQVSDISDILQAQNGARVTVLLHRDGKSLQISVQPAQCGQVWKLGLLVRDQIAGIGTLTYYDPASGRFGSLGHPVSGTDGKPVPIRGGAVLPVTITQVNKSGRGQPGTLLGTYQQGDPLGEIEENLPQGVFGTLYTPPLSGDALPVASASEVQTGPAMIRCTVDGNGIQAYTVEITAIRMEDANLRNLRLRVTDERLLRATGGIVQGISGAPIIQNGKLVGAVTHVLVDQPERGYGIYIGNMLRREAARAEAA